MNENLFVKTTLNGTEQWWIASFHTDCPSLHSLIEFNANGFKLWQVQKYINDMMANTLVMLVPVIEKSDEIFKTYMAERGSEEDKNPFTVRKRALPRMFANVHVHGNKTELVQFFSNQYVKETLTPGQQQWLRDTFEQQLLDTVTPELFAQLKKAIIKVELERLQDHVNNLIIASNNFLNTLQKVQI